MRQLKHDRAQEWTHTPLTTIGEACHLIARETLAKTIVWVVARTREGIRLSDITQQLTLRRPLAAFCKTSVLSYWPIKYTVAGMIGCCGSTKLR